MFNFLSCCTNPSQQANQNFQQIEVKIMTPKISYISDGGKKQDFDHQKFSSADDDDMQVNQQKKLGNINKINSLTNQVDQIYQSHNDLNQLNENQDKQKISDTEIHQNDSLINKTIALLKFAIKLAING
ncbi:UNKNOWN [Stylonychia lemnae]|uniref:Uncharacterized protein n=1 Tax=Stylonychia lemnae TaxID=5949 RepID=A0A078B7B6_STYLE|nr:UNKNOWN [Stylonychia lemnae]|eukprot:CDW89197.1 UNKNOWN [Stylonychia lemnae]